MNWKKLIVCCALTTLCSVPSWAGSFGVYGSFWDADEADKSFGAGARVGFDFVKFLELEFHATYFPDFETETVFGTVDIRAIPVDGGLKVNIIPEGGFNPYVGAGFTQYFLNSDEGNIDNETGWYGEAGFDAGGDHGRFFAEAMWRKLDAHVSLGVFDEDAKFDGITFNVGGTWRWGK
ncbi:MAG TPA: outer membrane beta-barrel protein [Candidatus Polarisedimenticolia bacterium]|nr:outer membrane beta-barrel protein [Candidatus Polarisedimenticolia bacterium]